MITLKKKNLPLFLIFLVPLALYWRGIFGGFVWDDRTYFIENDILPNLKPWQLSDILFHPSNLWGEHLPLREFLYVLEYNLFGLSPYGYHVVSLGLYILIGYVLYSFLLRLYSDLASVKLQNTSGFQGAEVSSLIVTILFLIHPSHVETVAYISGQKDLLVTLFSFSSMFLFYKYLNSQEGKGRFLFLGILTYYSAFLSKLTAISLILMFPLLWYISSKPLRPEWRKAFFFWVIINLPVAVWLFISINIVSNYSGMAQFADIGILDRIIRAFKILGFYTLHVLKPYPLSFGYPFDDSAGLDRPFWAGIFVASSLLILMVWRQKGISFFASTIYIIFLIPTLQIFGRFIYISSIYDRYLSIALLGMCILFERVIANVLDKTNRLRFTPLERKPHPNFLTGFAAVSVVIAVMISLSVITVSYVPTFKSDIDSTKNSYEKFPYWPSSAFNYVYSLIEGGRLDEAWDITIREVSFSYPPWVRSYFKGWVYLQRGELEEAIATLSYSSGIAIHEGYFPFPSIPLGKALMAAGRYKEAEQEFKKVLSSPINQPLEIYHARKELEKIRH